VIVSGGSRPEVCACTIGFERAAGAANHGIGNVEKRGSGNVVAGDDRPFSDPLRLPCSLVSIQQIMA
jgi:hypothetical protein